jgi:hypothetical protein
MRVVSLRSKREMIYAQGRLAHPLLTGARAALAINGMDDSCVNDF